jgi:hypothetical protein
LQEKFSASFEEFRGEVHVFVNPEQIVEALTLLRDKYDFELLSAMTATRLLASAVAALSCHLSTDVAGENLSMQLRVPVDGDQPTIPTATGVYEVANWRERELRICSASWFRRTSRSFASFCCPKIGMINIRSARISRLVTKNPSSRSILMILICVSHTQRNKHGPA